MLAGVGVDPVEGRRGGTGSGPRVCPGVGRGFRSGLDRDLGRGGGTGGGISLADALRSL